MNKIQEAVLSLFEAYSGASPSSVKLDALPLSGSNRRYFRIWHKEQTFIATYNDNIRENATFRYFSGHFCEKGLPVPQILAVNESGDSYLQNDLGNLSLLMQLEAEGYTPKVKELFGQSLHALARLQVLGHEGMDYTKCLTAHEFGKQAILSDLLYFKYYFLDTLNAPYDKQAMLDDFDALATYLTHTEYKFFMFRDFQSRNIMLYNQEPYFIDFQGGMRGAPQYDVASMLWQARANLPDDWKHSLLSGYMDSLDEYLPHQLDRNIFVAQYYGYVLIRLLQVLGAYGFRGLFERKAHFLSSIPMALGNLKWFIENRPLALHVPEFMRMLNFICTEDVIGRFDPPKANETTPLKVLVQSFSYKKNGYPDDESTHGGGFVFDCRGIFNPGRHNDYKHLSGKDKEVIDFLEQQTRMPDFLNSVLDLVDITVEDYMRRGFDRLTINFGCTGGQHRSVYAAEQTARHLRNKYKLRPEVSHINQQNWVTEKVETNA